MRLLPLLVLLLAGERGERQVGRRVASCPQPSAQHSPRRLSGREKREMQREILALLGLPGRSAPPAARPSPPRSAAAPLFMLDLYRAMASQDDDAGPGWAPQRRALDGADTVMSFVNVGESRR